MPTEKESIRIDFVHVDGKFDEKTGKFSGTLIPDPERYEWITIRKEKYLHDKFDDIVISETEFSKMFQNGTKSQPLYYSAPKIKDIPAYVKSRIPYIKNFLDGKKEDYKMIDKSEDFLKSLEKDEKKFVILTVDIKGSTKLSQSLNKKENAMLIALFAKEMAGIVNNYNGFILKYVGDGLIAYFPEPNFIGMNDNAVDCAMCMKYLIVNGINKVLLKKKLPKLKFRIGIDSGEAMIMDIGNEVIKKHKDLIGETINLSSKIQAKAKTNGISIDNATARNLHVSRKKWFSKYTPTGWNYTQKDGTIYPVYMMTTKFKNN